MLTLEEKITQLLSPLVDNRVFWDTNDEGVPITSTSPVIIIEQAGGESDWYVEGALPSHRNARLQISCWGKSRLVVNKLARLVEATIAESGLVARPYGAFTAQYDDALKLRGTLQHFGIWYADPVPTSTSP